MACGACRKNRSSASGVAAPVGTYRVMTANGRKVYESTNKDAAEAVAARFDNVTILTPGETA